VVRGTFSPARAWRPAVVARLARTLGIMKPNTAHAPRQLERALELFYREFPPSAAIGFVAMRFGDTTEHLYITELLKHVQAITKIRILRADHQIYHPDLFENVRVYMHACAFSLAFFEDAESRGFNPNVAIEVGYLQAINKPTLLLKSTSLSTLPTDILGRLYLRFNAKDPIEQLVEQVATWVRQQVISDLELNDPVTTSSVSQLLRSIYPNLQLEDDDDHVSRHVKGLRTFGYENLSDVVRLLNQTEAARSWVTNGRLPHYSICSVSNALAIRHPQYRQESFWKGTTIARLAEAADLYFRCLNERTCNSPDTDDA